MSIKLTIISIIFILIFLYIIIELLKKGKITIKYSILWILATCLLFILVLFPNLYSWLTKLLGFEVGSNMIFAGLFVILIFINITLTVIISEQNEKIRLLIQEVSIIKSKQK